MNITKDNFQFVPIVDLSEIWTDERLFEFYNLDTNEIDLITRSIREIAPVMNEM